MRGSRSLRHEAVAYERPALAYHCGRAALWRKPCWQGPDGRGECRGRAECTPVQIGDRWECRRPKLAGGKCDAGPLPEGSCCNIHPPCVPRHSLRRVRGHLTLVAVIACVLVLIIGVDPRTESALSAAALDAGNLTSVHAGFTREDGCASCHSAHAADPLRWFAAAFSRKDMSERCGDCHSFSGPLMQAHNAAQPKRPEIGPVSCVRCHGEHRGAAAKIAQVPDYICANCHQRSFDNFVGKHPEFRERFPHLAPSAIRFDHAKHLRSYFSDPKVLRRSKAAAELAATAKSQCTACHEVVGATREVRPKPYARICAACHDAQIGAAQLVLLEPERLTPASSVLLGLEKDGDEEAATKRLARLWEAMARGGVEALAELVPGNETARKKLAEALYAGMSAQTAREAGSAWAARRTLSGPAREGAGWAAGENAEGNPALFYRPGGHADPLVRAWIEFLRGTAQGKDKGLAKRAAEALDAFLDSDTGPGVCGKCHGVTVRSASAALSELAWWHSGKQPSPSTRYSHAPHLGLVDPDAGCKTCHELNPESRYAKFFSGKPQPPENYQSYFLGIRKEACVQCHREGQVNSACRVCHAYHLEHKFNLGFRKKRGPADERSAN